MGNPADRIDIKCIARGLVVRASNERELGDAVEDLLEEAGVEYAREVPLNRSNRIDFLIGGVGVELKVDGSLSALLRQLDRYATFDRIEELVVISTRRTHMRLPETIRGKTITGICVGGL